MGGEKTPRVMQIALQKAYIVQLHNVLNELSPYW